MYGEKKSKDLKTTDKKVRINRRLPLLTDSDNEWSAAVKGDINMVKYYIRKQAGFKKSGQFGFDIDKLSPYGRSALYMGALGGHLEVVRWLISEGAIDFDGTAYISCVNPIVRKEMNNAGFKGRNFKFLPHTQLLQAQRRMMISQIDIYDYDVMEVVVDYIDECLKEISSHRNTFKRWVGEQYRLAGTGYQIR